MDNPIRGVKRRRSREYSNSSSGPKKSKLVKKERFRDKSTSTSNSVTDDINSDKTSSDISMDEYEPNQQGLNCLQKLRASYEQVNKRFSVEETEYAHKLDCFPRTLELIGLIGKDFKDKLSKMSLNMGATREVITVIAKKINMSIDKVISWNPENVGDIYDWAVKTIEDNYFYAIVLSPAGDSPFWHAILLGNIYINELGKYEIVLLDSQRKLVDEEKELYYNVGREQINNYLLKGDFKAHELTLVGLYLDLSDKMKELKLEESSSGKESMESHDKVKVGKTGFKINSKHKRSRHKRSRHKRSRHKRSGHKRGGHKRSGHKRSRHKRCEHKRSRHKRSRHKRSRHKRSRHKRSRRN